MRRRARGLVVITAALALAACGDGTTPSARNSEESNVLGTTQAGVTKHGEDRVRTDLDPLTSRFSALGAPESAAWMSGTLGAGEVGPTTYWIDAVVHLEAGVDAELRALASDPADFPVVAGRLQAEVPDGELLRSDELDDAFTENGFSGRAYLAPDEPVLVLLALGE